MSITSISLDYLDCTGTTQSFWLYWSWPCFYTSRFTVIRCTMPISTNPTSAVEPFIKITICYIHDCLLHLFWLKTTHGFTLYVLIITYYIHIKQSLLCRCDLLEHWELLLDAKCCLFISSLVSVVTLAESTVLSVITPWKDTHVLTHSLTNTLTS